MNSIYHQFGILICAILSIFAAGADRIDPSQFLPECPEELRIHCRILENPWLRTPRTLVIAGGYVIGKLDPDCENEETRDFVSAVVAYEAAVKQLNEDPSDLAAISRVDRARMDLILRAKALRNIVGTLLVQCFEFEKS